MVATVGSISIDLVTNAAKFASGFKSSATTVEQQSGRMAKSIANIEKSTALAAGTLKTFMGGLAAGAGLAALTSLDGAFAKLKETISQFDEIATNAKTVGLKSDTYQALAFAAKQANIEQDSFNSSLSIFAKNAGLAQKGTGALFAGLQKLNPELLRNILSTTDQEKRLGFVADALARTKDATQQAALAAVVFGKGGVEMARFLDQGSASIVRMKKSAQDMGIIIPDELLQKAGEIDDKLDVLSTVIERQLSQALINLAPELLAITTGFADFSRELNKTASDINAFVQNPSIATFAKLFGKGGIQDVLNKFAGDTPSQAMTGVLAEIKQVEDELAQLKVQGEQGFSVGIQTEMANQKLDELQQKLVGLSKAARADLAQAFRAAENASMDALAAFRKESGSVSSLPNVTRYGAPANSVTPGSTYQADVNGSGVAVRKYGGISLSPTGSRTEQLDVNGSGVDVVKYNSDTADNTKDTASYTRDTADNIDTLDRNTHGYFRDLGDTVSDGAATISHSVSTLADLIGNEFGALPSYLIAALQANGGALNTGNISQPSTMFGDQWDPQHGSHVGDVINTGFRHTGGNVGSYHLSSYADDGSSNNQVTVQQPGNSYTLQYYAAPGDSLETTKQKARAAFDELVKAAASA
ncbi:hypothetical protein [Mesorhizobium sp.]|uniref:hypothetical protein n=1 Tax=Mesorhizobium sp. TaxID=1871066 RepID=UPI000FE8874D|nr:hypothetical protein [Mesorhizobium sp.]RWK12538.1 MAG: hypothetical protein EOR39_02765 [Mesorhizobium sp.]